MKKILLWMMMAISMAGYGQLKIMQSARYYRPVTFDVSPVIPVSTTNTGAAQMGQVRDSIAAMVISAGSGSVVSVGLTVPTGLSITGSPVTTTGVLAVSFTSGYSIPTTANQTNWGTAFTQTRQWDGGATGLTAATGRTSLGLGTAARSDSARFAKISHVGATGSAHGVSTTSVAGFMSAADKTKLDGISSGAGATYVHPATHSADMIVDGTTNKAYTAVEKTKLAGIAAGAEVNVNANWTATSGDALILNKPDLSVYALENDTIPLITVIASWDTAPATSTSAGKKGESRYTATATYHCYEDNHWNKTTASTTW
jgi:hypothetical protein